MPLRLKQQTYVHDVPLDIRFMRRALFCHYGQHHPAFILCGRLSLFAPLSGDGVSSQEEDVGEGSVGRATALAFSAISALVCIIESQERIPGMLRIGLERLGFLGLPIWLELRIPYG